MGYANASETLVSIVEESAWGVTPANPIFESARMTGEGLVYDIETVTSEEITPQSDVTDEVQVGASSSGPINFELSYGAFFRRILAHALRATWVDGVDGDQKEELSAGVERKSLTIEKVFNLDGSSSYSRFRGMVANNLSVTVEQGQIVTGSVEFLGGGESTATAAIAGSTYPADPTKGSPMAAPDVANIAISGVAGQVYYSSLSFTLSNDCSIRGAIGSKDAIGVKYGRRTIEGNLSAYFDVNSVPLYDKYVTGTEAAISFDMADADGNTYHVELPRTRFTTGRRVAGGNGEDVVAEMGFRALLDSSKGYSIKITRTDPTDV